MEDRFVTHVVKDEDGDILALCNPKEAWSPRKKADAIADIERGECKYLVGLEIHIVNDPDGKYLRTVPDCLKEDNLENMPECTPVGATVS
jgi:hypothetical protein